MLRQPFIWMDAKDGLLCFTVTDQSGSYLVGVASDGFRFTDKSLHMKQDHQAFPHATWRRCSRDRCKDRKWPLSVVTNMHSVFYFLTSFLTCNFFPFVCQRLRDNLIFPISYLCILSTNFLHIFSSFLICMIPNDLSQHRGACILRKVNLICPCRACVGARDPYCGWDLLLKKCTTLEESVRMSQWEQSITKCPVSCCLVNLSSFYLALFEPLIWYPVEKISFLLSELIPSQLKLRNSLEFSLNGSYTHIHTLTTSITHLWLLIH